VCLRAAFRAETRSAFRFRRTAHAVRPVRRATSSSPAAASSASSAAVHFRDAGLAQRFPLLPHALDAAARARREIGELERQLKTITDDQARLRANLKEMPSSAAAYKRYLEKFDQQETQIEEYQASIKKLQAVEHDQRKKFDDFLADFSAE